MRPTKYNKGKKPPAFISHLYRILLDSGNQPYIKWRQDQESFIILNIPKFSEIVLPKYYKHSNYSSFVRQLNMYNFNKVRSELEGEHIFRNELFRKDGEESLKIIKRREITNNNKTTNTIGSLAHAINSQIQQQNPLSDNINNMEIDLIQSSQQQSHQLMQMAAPSPQHSFLSDFPFPNLQSLKLFPGISQYLEQTDKIPPTIPLKPQSIYFPIKTKIDEMKSSQIQLEQICVSLFQQNQFLTSENGRLQDKLKNEFKRKQQILTQIIKYVINFLSEWNSNTSEVDDQNGFSPRENVISDEQSSSDIVLDSYDLIQKRKFQKKQKGQKHSRFTFSKHAQNQKKILLTLLKEIEKSYSEKFFFTNNEFEGPHLFDSSKTPKNPFYQQKHSSKSSPNSFLMSMLLEFIQSNNLAQVIKRFSLLINLQRNKKAKNFTVVNCMKGLKQHFKLKDLFSHENDLHMGRKGQKSIDYERIQAEGFERFVDKERYLENEKETIKQMEKQLAIMTNPNRKFKQLSFLEQDLLEQSQIDSSYTIFNPQNFMQRQKSQLILPQLKKKSSIMSQYQKKYFEDEQMDQLSDFEDKNEKYILQKFNFRLQ